MLVVSIVGKDVYQDHVVICTLDDIHNIDKVRNIIFNKYILLLAVSLLYLK